MWAVEGLTHRYPTKVLAELLPTCPQYCGHCTRMDLVGNSTPQIDKHKFAMKQPDRLEEMLAYLRRTPQVRDVVVSGGDVANMPWPRLESFVDQLLDVDNIRDIRLATKALMGLPQHWLQDDVRAGDGAPGHQGAGARRPARHPHPRQRRPVDDAAGRQGGPGHAGGRRPRRAQPGRADARRQRHRRAAARPVLRAAGQRRAAVLLLPVRHDPLQRALAAVAGRGAAPAARHHGLPARLRHPADRLRRALRRQAVGAPGRRLRHRARHLVLDEELPHRAGGRRPRGAASASTSTTTRSTPCPRPARPGGATTPARRTPRPCTWPPRAAPPPRRSSATDPAWPGPRGMVCRGRGSPRPRHDLYGSGRWRLRAVAGDQDAVDAARDARAGLA